MKLHSQIIHKIIFLLHIESIFILLKKYIPFFIKFIPLSDNYTGQSLRIAKRNNVYFNLLLSDYMQWHIYADLPDLSWQKATEFLVNNSCIIDVGANCGAFTLRLAQKAHEQQIENFKIYSFEPNPFVCGKLADNLKLNAHLRNYISILQLGLGKQEGVFFMDFSPKNTGGGKISNDPKNESLQVQVTTLDGFVEKEKISNITFIKIDVEGFEPFVIEGGSNTIKKYLPAMYIEITDEWFKAINSSQYKIIDFLKRLSYTLFIERDAKFVELENSSTPLEDVFQYNLLALPIHKK